MGKLAKLKRVLLLLPLVRIALEQSHGAQAGGTSGVLGGGRGGSGAHRGSYEGIHQVIHRGRCEGIHQVIHRGRCDGGHHVIHRGRCDGGHHVIHRGMCEEIHRVVHRVVHRVAHRVIHREIYEGTHFSRSGRPYSGRSDSTGGRYNRGDAISMGRYPLHGQAKIGDSDMVITPRRVARHLAEEDDGDDEDGDVDDDDGNDDGEGTHTQPQVKGMDDEDLEGPPGEDDCFVLPEAGASDGVFDKVDEAFETTIKGDGNVLQASDPEVETFASSNTNKEYMCDFVKHITMKEASKKVVICEMKIQEPLVKVKIVCPTKYADVIKYGSMEFFPKKAPYVTLVNANEGSEEKKESLKEKRLAALIHGVIITPEVNEKENNFEKGVIEFVLPPVLKEKKKLYYICDNGKSADGVSNHGDRGVAAITIEPYGQSVKGCNYTGKGKHFFSYDYEEGADMKHPCVFQLNAGEIGGIMFPEGTKSTSCFDRMVPHSANEKWDKKKKSLSQVINGAVVYNNDFKAKYFTVKYFSIPKSFREATHLMCHIQLTDGDKKHMVYISINQELNLSVFDLYEAFANVKKVIQIAKQTDDKKEYTCDFTDQLDKKAGESEKKVIICRKRLTEFDSFNMKCAINKAKYANLEMIPKMLKEEKKKKKNVLKVQLDVQYELFKKYFHFHDKYGRYLPGYPSFFSFPLNRVAKLELKKNSLFKNHKDSSYFDEVASPSDGFVKLLSFLDAQDTVILNEQVSDLTISDEQSTEDLFTLQLQIPPYITTNEPLYFLIGCNNTKDGGNLGIVELVISKNEHLVKGCNFSDGKMEHFTNNVGSTGEKCNITAFPNDVVGFNCSKTVLPPSDEAEDSATSNVVIEPEGCFTQVYSSSQKTDIVSILPGVLLYTSRAKSSKAFIKIPPVLLKDKFTFSCKCKIESVQNEMEVNVRRERESKEAVIAELKQEATTTGKEKDEGGMIYSCANKTLIEPKLEKLDDRYVKNTCHVDAKEMHSYVELFCPSRDLSIHQNINLYFNTVKPTKVESPKVLNQVELEKLIPHAEMLHKTRSILPLQSCTSGKEMVDISHVYLFFPYYVKEEQEFNILCDNSNTVFEGKRGGLLTYQVKVPKRSKKIKGCDFSASKSEAFLNESTANDCLVDAMPKDVIGFVCPPGTVKITSCFKEAVVGDNLINISEALELTDNMANYTHSHRFSYLEIPSVVSKDLSFKCICVQLKKDYALTSPPSAKLLEVIYQKMSIKKGEGYNKGEPKNKFLMSSLHLHLSHKKRQIVSIFQKVDAKNPSEEDANPEELFEEVAGQEVYDDVTGATCSMSQIRDNHISGDDYSVFTSVSDSLLEETITRDISSLNASDFKVYTLKVNLKAPKLLKPKKLSDNEYLCDFSKKSLIVPEPLTEESPPDIHCYSALKPLDTLYVKCPTEKAAYEVAKGKTGEEDEEEAKGIIALLEGDPADAGDPSAPPLDDASFVKYFEKVSMKPSGFFKNVLNEDGDKEEEIERVLPGAANTSMIVLKKKDPFTSYAAVIIPPSVSRNTFFKVQCNNDEYKEGAKNGGYKGVIHLDISRSEKKTIGCDFTAETSSIFTKGVLLPSGQSKECEVEATKNDIFGVRCSNESTFDPTNCFHEIYDKAGGKKKIKELIPDVKVFTLPNSKTKVAYGKIPLDYVNKINFSCSCTKADDSTKGTIKVIVNKEEASLEDMKLTDAVKHGQVNFCNFLDDEALMFEKNPEKIVQCKVDADLFSEVVVILPKMGSTSGEAEHKNLSVTPPLTEGEDIKVLTDEKTQVSLTTALKGVYGSRVFSFEKNSKKGIGLSFFIPPTFENKNFKLLINQSGLLSSNKQRGIVFIIVRKNSEPGSVKLCDFTSPENTLAELDHTNNEKVCSVRIAKGDLFGITCPKGFFLYPEACFSNVTLDYYKGELQTVGGEAEVEGYDADINYAERTQTNMRIKDLLHLLGDEDTEMEDLQKFSEFSNLPEMLNFETFHLGSMHLDFKKAYTSAYARVPTKFRSAIKFSCSCYNPQKKVFGTMDVETEYASSEEEPPIRADPFVRNKLLPLRSKISIDADEVEPIVEADAVDDLEATGSEGCKEEGPCGNMLSQGISYTCDFSQESLFTLIEGKLQRNTCTVDARALDVVTVKCPAIANHVHAEGIADEAVETEKVIITIDDEQFVTYQEEKTKKKTFSLKEIYDKEYYGMTSEEVVKLRKVDAGWEKHQVYYPKRVLNDVVVANKVTKLEEALPGVLLLQSKVNDELKTTELIADGVVRFIVPPYVRNDFQFHLFCGKSSETKPQGKNTSLGVIRVNVSANRKELQGCDFVNEKEDPHLVIFTNKRETASNTVCPISLIPNTVVGINCPSGKLLPDSCFHETYYVAESEAVTAANQVGSLPKEKITNVIKGAIPLSNFANKKNTYTYLILPKDMKSVATLNKHFYCTCNEGIIKMKVNTIYLKREKDNRVDKESCSYDSVKNVTTCNVVEFMESLAQKDNKTNHYSVQLAKWDKLILKYPTNEKENYEKVYINPINIKDKVLFRKVPTHIEDLLPGAITTNKLDSRTKIIEYTLRVPPYVSKEVHFSIEFNNSLTSKMVNYNVAYGGVVEIFIHVREGYTEISGCDFTGQYNHLFSHNFAPNLKESKTCSVVFGNNSYAGFACPTKFEIVPHNCFASVYDRNDGEKVKKLVDLSEEAEYDFVQYNSRGVSLSYLTFKRDTKTHSVSCKCVSPQVTHTINVTFEPDADHSLPKTRIRIRYFDLSRASFSSHLRGG